MAFRPRFVIAAAAALATLVAAPAPSQAAIRSEVVLAFNTANPANTGSSQISTPDVLASGALYAVTVSGTFTAYSPDFWLGDPKGQSCGKPDPAPVTPSPGRPATPAGQDAEFMYGQPKKRFCPNLPQPYNGFLVDFGKGFRNLDPDGGRPPAPRADHTYTYLITGKGKPATFAIFDNPTRDNNGVLTISVRPSTMSTCVNNPACAPPPQFAGAPTSVAGGVLVGNTLGASAPTESARKCVSKRKLEITLRDPRTHPYRRVTAEVNGKKVKVRHRKRKRRFVLVVNMRGRSRQYVDVEITRVTHDGRRRTSLRTFKTCTPKSTGRTGSSAA